MNVAKTLPARAEVPIADQWDLSSLFSSDDQWEAAFSAWEKKLAGFDRFKGRLADGPGTILDLLKFDAEIDRAAESLGNYAFLKTAGDQGDSNYQRMKGRYTAAATKANEAASFIRPELMAIPADLMDRYLQAPELADWKLALDRTLRYRPHTLGNKEEQLLAMQGQMAQSAGDIFRQLNDADLKWPLIKNERGELVELGHSSYSAFMHSADRPVRREAFHAYYGQFEAHKNTIAAALNGSGAEGRLLRPGAGVSDSARESSLFHDNVPVGVYDSLIKSVRKNLPAVHKYYALRKRAMKLDGGIHAYDTYVPILADLDKSAHLGPGREGGGRFACPARVAVHVGVETGPDDGPLVRPVSQRRQAERGVQQRQF